MKNKEIMEKQVALNEALVDASSKYYNGLDSGMSDMEFDRKVEELKLMESETGVVLPGSPTVNVGAATSGELQKVKHEKPALSLDKVKYKNRNDLVDWLKGSNGHDSALVSWKCDGLTGVATYDNGKLTSLVTRGDGSEGSDITHNAAFIGGIPKSIVYKEHMVVRGEMVMDFAEFDRINSELPDDEDPYENPRNLAGSTVQLPKKSVDVIRNRKTHFVAFELVAPEPTDSVSIEFDNAEFFFRFQQDRFDFLEYLGFDVVDHECCSSMDVLSKIEEWKEDIVNLKFPTDGLVITFNDMVYGMSLGNTGHHFRHSLALKWSDETVTTTIRDIDWSVGKTGIITPVAVFDEVRLGLGSNVTRASLHNISIMRNMPAKGSFNEKEPIRIGSEAEVYLANMIIPQIASIRNTWDGGLTWPTKYIKIPDKCPVCGAPTAIVESNGIQVLRCTGDNCAAQQVGKLMNTFSKDGLFVKGLGESQIQDLINEGLADSSPLSFYDLANEDRANSTYPKESEFAEKVSRLWSKDGWGKKKWENLINAIEASRETTLQKFLYSLNVPLLGNDLSKKLSKYWDGDVEKFKAFVWDVHISTSEPTGRIKMVDMLKSIDGIGEEKALNLVIWAEEITAYREIYEDFIGLINELRFPEKVATSSDNSLEGLTFVITGAVHVYKNRDEFKASVEARGGKVSGSVSARKTSFLVNNDVNSTSGKNQAALAAGIPIISEDEFIARFGK